MAGGKDRQREIDTEKQTERDRHRERNLHSTRLWIPPMATLRGQRKAEKAQPNHVLFLVLVLSSID